MVGQGGVYASLFWFIYLFNLVFLSHIDQNQLMQCLIFRNCRIKTGLLFQRGEKIKEEGYFVIYVNDHIGSAKPKTPSDLLIKGFT